MIFGTQRIKPEQWDELKAAGAGMAGRFSVTYKRCDDEDETGYPRSATHLFIRSLEFCTSVWPKKAVLWMETDCFPVAPDWFEAIVAEYNSIEKDFMGVYVDHLTPHMAGCGIYPTNWKTQAPKIMDCLFAPDLPEIYGVGKGQAWDTFAGNETIQHLFHCKTIQQIWRPGTFTEKNIERVLPATKLFHQCKNGSLIGTIAALKYPDFLKLPADSKAFYQLFSCLNHVTIADTEVEFTPCARGPGGATFSVFKPTTVMEEALMATAHGRNGITKISAQDYNSLLRQSHVLRLQ